MGVTKWATQACTILPQALTGCWLKQQQKSKFREIGSELCCFIQKFIYNVQQATYKHEDKISCVTANKAPAIARVHKHCQKRRPSLHHVPVWWFLRVVLIIAVFNLRWLEQKNSVDIEALVGQFGEKAILSSSCSPYSPCAMVAKEVV